MNHEPSLSERVDAMCAAAIKRVHKSIDLRIKRALFKAGDPSPTRSVGQIYRLRVAK